MAIFKPVMVKNKNDLNNIVPVPGQYIIVTDANELYLDKGFTLKEREKVSQNIYIQATEPTNMKKDDIWFVIEPELPDTKYIKGTWKLNSFDTSVYIKDTAEDIMVPFILNSQTQLYGMYISLQYYDGNQTLIIHGTFDTQDGPPEGPTLKLGDEIMFGNEIENELLLKILQNFFIKISN